MWDVTCTTVKLFASSPLLLNFFIFINFTCSESWFVWLCMWMLEYGPQTTTIKNLSEWIMKEVHMSSLYSLFVPEGNMKGTSTFCIHCNLLQFFLPHSQVNNVSNMFKYYLTHSGNISIRIGGLIDYNLIAHWLSALW